LHQPSDRADPEDPFKITDRTRELGLIVCRGTAVTLICPIDGMTEIENPFTEQEAEAEADAE
jgi:U6 snRNA-associated Sm-like protein LSm7